jgi:DNA-binding winged helix-turn-helix (wHTH) protein
MHDQDISFGPFRLITSRRLLLEGDRRLHIGSRALTILQVLLERAGEVVEKKELARLVWPNTFVDEANIRVHIAALRRRPW